MLRLVLMGTYLPPDFSDESYSVGRLVMVDG